MAAFLLFMFIFASQVIGGFNAKLPPPSYGNTITILSIDGGGVKGILPTYEDEKAALADYFDVIAGTSTGGLIATMLSTPGLNDASRPAFTAPEILKFYLENAPSIFNLTLAANWTMDTRSPKFDGVFLREKVWELLQGKRLHETLTNLVITSYDILQLHPVIFSSLKIKEVPSRDVRLADIVLGTSAAPLELPPHFILKSLLPLDGFNLADGSLTATSPALIAVSEVVQQLNNKNPNFVPVNKNEATKIVLLSIGTGRNGETKGYDALKARFFTGYEWIPLIAQSLGTSMGDMNEYHLKSVFPDLPTSDNYYLRIDEYNLDKSITPENTTAESMDNIIKAGEDLLKQTVKAIDINSFTPQEKPSEGTNAEALDRLAKILYNEKQLRLKRKSMEKREQAFSE
ncbi:patatin protein [Trifolium repens]|nr:patatin protein [Trifolium repens]